jgi:hypothetical protein
MMSNTDFQPRPARQRMVCCNQLSGMLGIRLIQTNTSTRSPCMPHSPPSASCFRPEPFLPLLMRNMHKPGPTASAADAVEVLMTPAGRTQHRANESCWLCLLHWLCGWGVDHGDSGWRAQYHAAACACCYAGTGGGVQYGLRCTQASKSGTSCCGCTCCHMPGSVPACNADGTRCSACELPNFPTVSRLQPLLRMYCCRWPRTAQIRHCTQCEHSS